MEDISDPDDDGKEKTYVKNNENLKSDVKMDENIKTDFKMDENVKK